VQITGPFDGFHATQASVSKTCLVRFDNHKYSVASRAVGSPIEIRAYADRIAIRQEGAIVSEHRRRFGRGETIYDPWHYVPVLARKPGAVNPLQNAVVAPGIEIVLHGRKRWKLAWQQSPLTTSPGHVEKRIDDASQRGFSAGARTACAAVDGARSPATRHRLHRLNTASFFAHTAVERFQSTCCASLIDGHSR